MTTIQQLRGLKLQGSSPYLAKDQAKSDRATCFIGRGSSRSSTHRYMLAWGELANKSEYTSEDIVFISSEGARSERLQANFAEIRRACLAKARIITDVQSDRERPYNVGEREVALFLINECCYHEPRPGQWISRG